MDFLFKRISATIMRSCFNLDYNSRVITGHDQATNDFRSHWIEQMKRNVHEKNSGFLITFPKP